MWLLHVLTYRHLGIDMVLTSMLPKYCSSGISHHAMNAARLSDLVLPLNDVMVSNICSAYIHQEATEHVPFYSKILHALMGPWQLHISIQCVEIIPLKFQVRQMVMTDQVHSCFIFCKIMQFVFVCINFVRISIHYISNSWCRSWFLEVLGAQSKRMFWTMYWLYKFAYQTIQLQALLIAKEILSVCFHIK